MDKGISQDVVKLIIDGESSKLQQAAHQAATSIRQLEKENDSLLEQQKAMRKAKITEGKEWDDLSKKIVANDQKIRQHKKDLQALTQAIGVNSMTMSQLRKEAKSLQRQLDNTSKDLEPKQWQMLSDKLAEVKNRMSEVSGKAQELKESMVQTGAKSFLLGTGILRAFDWLKDKMTELIGTSLELAESTDGVAHAFAQLDRGDELLAGLRKATKGTVNDFELMKSVMKAKDFRIPLEDLGKLLSFAQLKAQQTGQSVDYMVDSIVTGLGRQSKMILDNLGISAAEIDEKMQETGDFAKAVANIIDTQLKDAGDTYVSAADRALQRTTALQNKQLELGQALLKVKEDFANSYGEIIITLMSALKWIITHKKETALLAFGLASLTVTAIATNTALKAYVLETKAATLVTATFGTVANTAKGIWLLLSSAIWAMTGNTAKATAAMRLFNMTCKTNVIVLMVTAVIALGAAMVATMTKTKQATDYARLMREEHQRLQQVVRETGKVLTRDLQDVEKKASDQTVETTNRLKLLRKELNDNTQSNKKRLEALNEIRKIVPTYHAELTTEGKLIKNNTSALDDYITNLRKTAQAQAVMAKMTEISQQEMDNQLERQQVLMKRNYQSNKAMGQGVNLHTMRVREATRTYTDNWGNQRKGAERYEVVDAAGNVVKGLENVSKSLYIAQQEFDKRTAQLKTHDVRTTQNEARSRQMEEYAKKNNLNLTSTSPSAATPQTKPVKSGSGNGSAEDSKSLDDFKRARQAELDVLKATYEQEIELLRQQLAEKKLTREQYDSQALGAEIAYKDNVLKVEKDYQQQSETLALNDSQKKKDIQQGQQQNVIRAEQESNQAKLRAYEQYQAQLNDLQNAGMTESERLKKESEMSLAVLDAYYEASKEYAEKNGQDVLAIDQAYWEARRRLVAENEQKEQEQRQRIRSQYGLTTQGELMQADMDALLRQYDEGLISLEDYYKARESIEQEYEDRKQQVRQQYGLVTKAEEYQMQLDQLREYKEQELLTEQEYEEAKKQLRMQNLKESFDYWQNQVSTAVSALQDAEMAQVDAKYDAEIAAAKKAGKDTTQLEAKKEEEKLKIQKKYADVNFAVKCAEIVSNTAVSIMKALAELGPIAGPIAAGLMAVTGAAQLAIAKAERDRVKNMTAGSASSSAETGARVATGKEEGGYMADDLPDGGYTDVIREQDGKWFHAKNEPRRRGYIDRPTVIVGEGPAGKSKEWVASNAAVENPTVRPVIDAIDQAQRTGNVRTLDLRKVLLQRGLQAGGYLYTPGGNAPGTGTPSGNAPGTTQHPSPNTPPSGKAPGTNAPVTDAVLTRLTDVLDRIEQNGIPALVGVDQIEASQKQRDQARAIATK